MADDAVAVVRAWQAAANQADGDALAAVSDPEIEVVGPRGSGYGHQLLREWLARAGLTLTTRHLFARGDTVVAAQHAMWRDAATGATSAAEVASLFRVRDGRVAQYARFDTLAEALDRGGLSQSDAVAAPPDLL